MLVCSSGCPHREGEKASGTFCEKFLRREIASATGVCRMDIDLQFSENREGLSASLISLLISGPFLALFFDFSRKKGNPARHARARTEETFGLSSRRSTN